MTLLAGGHQVGVSSQIDGHPSPGQSPNPMLKANRFSRASERSGIRECGNSPTGTHHTAGNCPGHCG
jgi:hypothetical protein